MLQILMAQSQLVKLKGFSHRYIYPVREKEKLMWKTQLIFSLFLSHETVNRFWYDYVYEYFYMLNFFSKYFFIILKFWYCYEFLLWIIKTKVIKYGTAHFGRLQNAHLFSELGRPKEAVLFFFFFFFSFVQKATLLVGSEICRIFFFFFFFFVVVIFLYFSPLCFIKSLILSMLPSKLFYFNFII